MFSNKTSRKCRKYATMHTTSCISFVNDSKHARMNLNFIVAFNVEILFSINVAFACYKWEHNGKWCVYVWFSRFIPDIFHKYEWFFFILPVKRSVYTLNDAIRYPSLKRWFFNNRPMTSNKLFRFNGLGFNLVFKKGAWKWFQEKKRKKKQMKTFLFQIIANTFFMELKF